MSFDTNPDIDEKPPMPIREYLEKMKPFLMAYEGIQSHEECEVCEFYISVQYSAHVALVLPFWIINCVVGYLKLCSLRAGTYAIPSVNIEEDFCLAWEYLLNTCC